MNRTVTARGREIMADTPGRLGLASSWSRICTLACSTCGLAISTDAAIKEFADRRAELERVAAEKLSAAQAVGAQIEGRTVRIAQKAGVDGRLFGSVTNHDIAEALGKVGITVSKAQVRMPNGPLKTVGEYSVTVAPHTDVVSTLTVQVVAQAD